MCHFVASIFSLWFLAGWPVCDFLSVILLGASVCWISAFQPFLKSLTSLPTILSFYAFQTVTMCVSAHWVCATELWCPGCAFYYWLFFPTVCFIVGSFSRLIFGFPRLLYCVHVTTKPLQRVFIATLYSSFLQFLLASLWLMKCSIFSSILYSFP